MHLDSIEVSSTKTYQVKYEFWEKNLGAKSYEDKTISAGHMGSSACSKPFVVQELAIVSKDLLQQRVRAYKDAKAGDARTESHLYTEHDITALGETCDFKLLDNQLAPSEGGERGLYCNKKTHTYRP